MYWSFHVERGGLLLDNEQISMLIQFLLSYLKFCGYVGEDISLAEGDDGNDDEEVDDNHTVTLGM